MGIDRINGNMNSITFGAFAALCFFGLLLIACLESKQRVKAIFFVASLIALAAVLKSGSRGIIFSAGLTVIILLGTQVKYLMRGTKSSLILLSLASVVVLAVSYSSLQGRVDSTMREFSFLKRGHMDLSIGRRIQMWRSSPYVVREDLWFGLGDNHNDRVNELYEKNQITFKSTPHYHNLYLDKLVKGGLVGLALLLSLLLYPLMVALKEKEGNIFCKYYLVAIISLMMFAGLTDVPLNHAPIIYFYVFSVFFMLHQLRKQSSFE